MTLSAPPKSRPLNGRFAQRDDSQLVSACLRGDAGAWDALIERYQALIYSTLLKQGLSSADADDMFQDVCLILFRYLEDLRDSSRLSGWLISTARREAWRLKRRRGAALASELAEREWEMESAEPVAQAAAPSPDQEILALQEQQLVREGLARLGDRCRELLTFLYLREPPGSYAEVVERFGMPQGSIGPTRARCLQQLQKHLMDAGF